MKTSACALLLMLPTLAVPVVNGAPLAAPGAPAPQSAAPAVAPSTAQGSSAEWQKEAIRLYPDIAKPDSALNQQFVAAVKNARANRPALFNDARWPLLLAQEVATGVPAQPGTPIEEIAQALTLKKPSLVVEACGRFTHPDGGFRASVSELSKQIAAASQAEAKARKARMDVEPEIARLQKNAAVTDRPNPLDPKDTTPHARAEEMRKKAADLSASTEQALADAQGLLEAKYTELAQVVETIRAAEADRTAKREQTAQESELQRQQMAQEAARAKAILAFQQSVSEPEGTPGFAGKNVTPSYADTLEFINGRLPDKWKLMFGDTSKQFLLFHPEGACFVELAMLNAAVKPVKLGDQVVVRLETSKRGYSIRSLSNSGAQPQDVKRINIPCGDQLDAERLSNALRHLILMAGGKDDPF